MTEIDDATIGRVLRWAVIEKGTADLSDSLGPEVIAPSSPQQVLPRDAAVAGKVLLFCRQRPTGGERPPSSFEVLRRAIAPGDVVMVQSDPSIGAAFGSNIALQAAACHAQAIITDGSFRDTGRLRQVGIPVASSGSIPTRPAGCPMVAVETIDMFGVVWTNGDWLLRDLDGVLRLDHALAVRTANELIDTAAGELASLVATYPDPGGH